MIIEKATRSDLAELERLYDELNDFLTNGTNYPGWIKGVYPVRETAAAGIEAGALYVLRENGCIAATIILNHEPENAYRNVKWQVEANDEEIFVIHTLAIHPDYMKNSFGRTLLDFAKDLGRRKHLKAIRLDVTEKNLPAIRLYKSCGYSHIATVNLDFEIHGLERFELYELVL